MHLRARTVTLLGCWSGPGIRSGPGVEKSSFLNMHFDILTIPYDPKACSRPSLCVLHPGWPYERLVVGWFIIAEVHSAHRIRAAHFTAGRGLLMIITSQSTVYQKGLQITSAKCTNHHTASCFVLTLASPISLPPIPALAPAAPVHKARHRSFGIERLTLVAAGSGYATGPRWRRAA